MRPNLEVPVEFVKSLGWKHRVSGDEIEAGCPFDECPNKGQNQFYINSKTGSWLCFRCNNKGKNLKALAFKLKLVTLQEPVQSGSVFVTEKDVLKMHEDLLANEDAMNYLENKRAHKMSGIKQALLGLKIVDGEPAIAFPIFDGNGHCVGLHYDIFRRPAGVSKYKFEKDSKRLLYTISNLDMKQPLVITEGYHDALTAWEYGFENVGSVPNGANSVGEWVDPLKAAEKFLLAFDNDPAGMDGAKKLAAAVGLSKCSRVLLRCKDLNEAAQFDVPESEVRSWFETAEPMFEAPALSIDKYKDQIKEVLSNPDQNRGYSTGWEILDYHIGGLKTPGVTVFSGVTKHGKSSFSHALVGNNISNGIKSLVISPELSEADVILDLASNHFKERVNDYDQVCEFIDEAKESVFIPNVFNSWTEDKPDTLIKSVFDLIDYSAKHLGVEFILIDHMRLFIDPPSSAEERHFCEKFMKNCVRASVRNKIHIWLVVQPGKLDVFKGQVRKLTFNDLKGTANITQDASNIILLHREVDDNRDTNLVEIEVCGVRSKVGQTGTFTLEFDTKSKANYYEVS